MHSRLYTRVLNQAPWVHNATAFNSIYNSSGLVGIFASAESSRAGEVLDVLTKEIQVGGCGGGETELNLSSVHDAPASPSPLEQALPTAS